MSPQHLWQTLKHKWIVDWPPMKVNLRWAIEPGIRQFLGSAAPPLTAMLEPGCLWVKGKRRETFTVLLRLAFSSLSCSTYSAPCNYELKPKCGCCYKYYTSINKELLVELRRHSQTFVSKAALLILTLGVCESDGTRARRNSNPFFIVPRRFCSALNEKGGQIENMRQGLIAPG